MPCEIVNEPRVLICSGALEQYLSIYSVLMLAGNNSEWMQMHSEWVGGWVDRLYLFNEFNTLHLFKREYRVFTP